MSDTYFYMSNEKSFTLMYPSFCMHIIGLFHLYDNNAKFKIGLPPSKLSVSEVDLFNRIDLKAIINPSCMEVPEPTNVLPIGSICKSIRSRLWQY